MRDNMRILLYKSAYKSATVYVLVSINILNYHHNQSRTYLQNPAVQSNRCWNSVPWRPSPETFQFGYDRRG